MKRIVFNIIFFSLINLLFSSEDLKIYKTNLERWKMLKMDNSLIEIGICPEIGLRIMEFKFKNGNNWLRVESPEYLNKKPLDVGYWSYGRNYGGMFDVGSPTWPGIYFFSKKYDYKINKNRKFIEIKGWTEEEKILIERSMKIFPNSTKFEIDIKEKNLKKFPREMMIRLHNEFNNFGETKIIFFDKEISDEFLLKEFKPELLKKNSIKKIDYVKGKEEGRGFYNAPYGWVGVANVTNQEVMVRKFEPEKGTQFLLWMGAEIHEGEIDFYEEPLDYEGFYNIEVFHKPEIVKPGDSISAKEIQFLIKGMRDIDFYIPKEEIVGDIEIEKKVYDSNDELKFTFSLGSPEIKESKYIVEIYTINEKGEILKKMSFLTSVILPGESIKFNEKIRLDGFSSGEYFLLCKILKNGEIIGFGWETFKIDNESYKELEKRLSEVKLLLNKMEERMKKSPNEIRYVVEFEVYKLKFEKLKRFFDENEFSKGIKFSETLIEDIENLISK